MIASNFSATVEYKEYVRTLGSSNPEINTGKVLSTSEGTTISPIPVF